jgi:hypothetical protein
VIVPAPTHAAETLLAPEEGSAVRLVADVTGAVVLTVVTLAALSVTTRVRFARRPGAFRCRLGTGAYPRRRRDARWRLRRTTAMWVSDVLVVRTGLLRLGVTPMAARIAPGEAVRTLGSSEVRGLGRRPAALVLSLENRETLEIAVAEASRLLLVGPYLAAGLSDLPTAPRERGA